MTVLAVWLLVALLLDLALGVVVYLAHTRRTVNRHYLTLSMVVGAWLVANWHVLHAESEPAAGMWIRIATAAASMIPVCCNVLRICVAQPGLDWAGALRRTRRLWALNAAVIAVCFLPPFLRGVRMPVPPNVVADPVYGPAFVLFVLYFVGVLVYLAFAFFRERRHAVGAQRAELDFLILGSISALLVGTVFSLLLAVTTGSSRAVPLANALSIIALTAIVGYGVAVKRIMPLAELLRRVTVHVLLAMYALLVYLAVWFVTDRTGAYLVGGVGARFLPHLLAAVAAALAVRPLHGSTHELAERLFRRSAGSTLTGALQGASRMLQSVTTVDSLVAHLRAFVREAVSTDRCLVLLREPGGYVNRGGEDAGECVRLEEEAPLVARMENRREPLVMDTLTRRRISAADQAAAAQLVSVGGQFALGIYSKTDLEGILLLGPRRRGQLYGPLEQDALQILANQAAVALENAALYTRIQREKDETAHLLDNLMGGVIAVDGTGRTTVFNREARRITAAGDTRYIGRPASELPAPFAKLARTLVDTCAPWQDHETSVPRPGQAPVVVRMSGAFFRGEVHEGGMALLVFRDVTRLKELENQVRRTDRLASMGTLSAGMAHEIRNPLVSIKTFAQLLPSRYEDPDFRDTFTPIIAHEVERLEGLVKQLLDFARPREPELVPMGLHGVLRESVNLARHKLRPDRVEVVEAFEAGRDSILGDAGLLEQGFVNLFLNAGDAMEGEGRLTLRTANKPAGSIRVDVIDTGQGIRPEDLGRVFDPFFTTKPSGTGLGLSVVHGIIDEHHARIDVDSRVGEGTTFTLLFRLASAENPA